MNISAISGRLTADVELKATPSGKSVVSFTVAVSRPHTKDATDYIDCVAWGEKAEFVSKFFRKGSRIEVTGTLQTKVYGEEGAKRKATELHCSTVQFGESKKSQDSSPTSSTPVQHNPYAENKFETVDYEEIDEDCPF